MRPDPKTLTPALRAGVKVQPAHAVWLVTIGTLGLVILVHVQAGLAWRGFHADGAYYFLEMLVDKGFHVLEHARETSQYMMQAPLALYLREGGGSLSVAASLFSLSLNVIPFLLVAACAAICPPDRREVVWFPLFVCFAAMMGSSVAAIADGNLAAAYFWVVLILLVWRARTLPGQICLALLAYWMLPLHEGMMFLGPVLALAAGWRAVTSRRIYERIGFTGLAAWFLYVAGSEGRWMLFPVDQSRDVLTDSLLRLRWLHVENIGMNGPALLGVLAGATILALVLARRPDTRVLAGFTALAVAVAAATWLWGYGIAPMGQYVARHNAVLLSAPVGLLMLAGAARPALLARLLRPEVGMVLVVLGVSGALCHVAITRSWERYLTVFQEILETHAGELSDAEAWGTRSAEDQHLSQQMGWAWTSPSMSLVLAPGGVPRTIIADRPPVPYVPFDPANPATLPQSRLLDLGPYTETLRQHSPARDAAGGS